MKPLASGVLPLALRWPAAAALLCAVLALPHIAKASSLTASTSLAFPGQPITFTAIPTGPPSTGPTVLDFGDAITAGLVEPYPAFASHSYALTGVYTVKLETNGARPFTLAQTTVTIVAANTFSLTANPTSVIAGQVVTFSATTGARPLPGAYVDFGDGSTAPAPSNFNTIQHRYASPALFTARLAAVGNIGTLAQAQVSVTPNTVQVPVGQVYSTFLVGSPVLAGADTAISLSFRMFTPFVIGPTGVSPLQAIVELSTTKGVVIQRSDPFALPFTQQNVNSPQTVMIPYTVPADAGGNYLITVYVRSATGGTVAVGRPQTIQIIGGPDPAPIVSNAFHANGAILTRSGANRGSYGVNLGLTTAAQWATDELLLTGLFDPVSKKVDPLLTFVSATPAPITSPNATPAPNSTSTQVDSGHVPPPPTTGSPEPGSEPAGPRPAGSSTPAPTGAPSPSSTATAPPQPTVAPSPPKSTSDSDQRSVAITAAIVASVPAAAASATPQPQPTHEASAGSTMTATPAAQPPPAPEPAPAPPPQTPPPTPLQFKDVLGRTDASLPAVIGSKETLRGLDLTYVLPDGWTLHGGGGYFQLASNETTERSGGLLDATRAWNNGADTFRAALSDNADNVNKFVQTGTSGPLRVGAGVFEFTEMLTPHLRWLLTGGQSNTYQLTGGLPTLYDTVAQTDLNYNVGATTFDVEYHNAGPQFGTLSGASALSDRAGGAASLSFTTSPISQVQMGYGHDAVRSAFSDSTRANAVFNITPPRLPGISLTLERDTAAAPGSKATTNSVNLGLNKSGISTFTVTGTLVAVNDALNPEAYATQRTGVFTYQYANGPHTLGFGVNATNTTSASPTATVSESINYGFTFGGRLPPNSTGQPFSPGTRYFEAKFALTNVNSQAFTAGAHTATFAGLLSWHVTPQLAPGIEANYQKQYMVFPVMDTSQNSFLRFRLDVNV
jgi:hypothetical protein